MYNSFSEEWVADVTYDPLTGQATTTTPGIDWKQIHYWLYYGTASSNTETVYAPARAHLILSVPVTDFSQASNRCNDILDWFAPGDVGQSQTGAGLMFNEWWNFNPGNDGSHDLVDGPALAIGSAKWTIPSFWPSGMTFGTFGKAVGNNVNPPFDMSATPPQALAAWTLLEPISLASLIPYQPPVRGLRMRKAQTWITTPARNMIRRVCYYNRTGENLDVPVSTVDTPFTGGALVQTLPPAFDSTYDVRIWLVYA